jgi:putative transcriptional regulator
MTRRSLFEELKQSIEEFESHDEGKITLRHYEVRASTLPEVTKDLIRSTRESLNVSRAVFAHQLHIAPRTLEKWEQGLSKPNDQASVLLLLVKEFPDTLERLGKLGIVGSQKIMRTFGFSTIPKDLEKASHMPTWATNF